MPHPRDACLVLAFVLAAPLAALCDPADDFIRTEMARQRIPGLSLAVLRNGEVIKTAGYGLADRRLKIAATPDTVYKIAAASKQFIATGIMLLVRTPVTLNDGATRPYGFGWMLATVRGARLIDHPGGMPGFRSDIARFVDDDVTIIALMNLDDVDIDAIIGGLAALYLTPAQ